MIIITLLLLILLTLKQTKLVLWVTIGRRRNQYKKLKLAKNFCYFDILKTEICVSSRSLSSWTAEAEKSALTLKLSVLNATPWLHSIISLVMSNRTACTWSGWRHPYWSVFQLSHHRWVIAVAAAAAVVVLVVVVVHQTKCQKWRNPKHCAGAEWEIDPISSINICTLTMYCIGNSVLTLKLFSAVLDVSLCIRSCHNCWWQVVIDSQDPQQLHAATQDFGMLSVFANHNSRDFYNLTLASFIDASVGDDIYASC